MMEDRCTSPIYYSHSNNKAGKPQTQVEHLGNVANLAATFAQYFACEDEARFIGLLHDLGKYSPLFQRRLEGAEKHVDHWSPGAWAALKIFHALTAAMAIQGHHIGLQRLDKDSLRDLDPALLSRMHPAGMQLSETDTNHLLALLAQDGFTITPPQVANCLTQREVASTMLDVRMLFSALVDADFLDTEAHFRTEAPGVPYVRPTGPPLDAERALGILLAHMDTLAFTAHASEKVLKVRADLLRACLEGAESPAGLWTMSAPTGSGKTLAMLAFALRHAITHKLRRIVLVIPYLSIIEQTAKVYRELFTPHFGEDYILEHHSLAGTRDIADGDQAQREEQQGRARLLAQNWDAPIIITTSVQLLESLLANRPSACRKLHRLAQSVVIFDEVQTLPVALALPTLATLARLAERYRASVVFSTATQPAFSHLDAQVQPWCALGWQPREIVPTSLNLFGRSHRVEIRWPDTEERQTLMEIAGELALEDQALCIVNLKRHARELVEILENMKVKNVLHLSTSMCPAHRQQTLEQARRRLDLRHPQSCLLIATQCIEAGVDIDFPVVYRAFAPLEAIAQAAGRCNRHDLRPSGAVRVFRPADPSDRVYPNGAYQQAADITNLLLRERGADSMDINDPTLFDVYYRKLYDLAQPHLNNKKLLAAMRSRDFVDVAKEYRLIPEGSINILVPCERILEPRDREVYLRVKEDVLSTGLTADWMRRAQPYTVSLYRPQPREVIWQSLIPIPINHREVSEEWFIYQNLEDYHKILGLTPPNCPPLWLA